MPNRDIVLAPIDEDFAVEAVIDTGNESTNETFSAIQFDISDQYLHGEDEIVVSNTSDGIGSQTGRTERMISL